MTDAGARALAGALSMALRQLYLSANEITGAGVEALMASPVTKELEYLRLSMNPIGDAGARAIAEQGPKGLTILFLERTAITDAGFRAIVDSPRLASLDWLALGQNALTADAVAALADPAKLPALTTLEVDAKAVDDALLAKLKAARPGLKISAQ